MKKLISLFLALLMLCSCGFAEKFQPELTVLSPLQIALLRLNITPDVLPIAASGTPQPLCEDVEIILAEVGANDVLFYGGAVVRPADPGKTLLMPGNQFWDEDCPYQDGRNWVEVAADEGKTLYAVYVYPVALDASPMYALDSWALFGGAMVTLGYGAKDLVMPDTLDLTVQIYHVDDQGKFTAVVNTLVSLEVEGSMTEAASVPGA